MHFVQQLSVANGL